MATTPYLATLKIIDDAPAADVARLEAHLDAFNALKTGIADARSLSLMLRHADGELYAGLHGHTWGECCYVKLLWISEHERRRGLGTALLETAEREARRRGCRQVMLTTHSFQAPAFYEKHGFRPIAVVPDNPVGHADILMFKPLGGRHVARAILRRNGMERAWLPHPAGIEEGPPISW